MERDPGRVDLSYKLQKPSVTRSSTERQDIMNRVYSQIKNEGSIHDRVKGAVRSVGNFIKSPVGYQ